MKNTYILLFLTTLLFYNCEKVIEVDLPSIEPKLVVDATFEVFFDKNPVTADTNVKLTLTADFFSDTFPTVNNATVFITNDIDDVIVNYTSADTDGNYQPNTPFIPQDDVAYKLNVIHNGETYTSNATKTKSSPLTNIEQTSRVLFTDEVVELKVSFNDIADVENFYLFDYSEDSFSIVSDELFENGSEITTSEFYDEEDLELPQTLTVKMSGITRAYFNYFRILTSQAGTGGGGPFETVPSTLLGNVINQTTEANFPLGFFHIAETDTITIDLVEKE